MSEPPLRADKLRRICPSGPDPRDDLDPTPPKAWGWLTAGSALAAIPVVVLFWYTHVFGVNVVNEDSWNGTLPLVFSVVKGKLNLAMLWAPHNGNRMLFPNLVTTFSDYLTHVNAKTDMYLSALCWLFAVVLLIRLAAKSSRVRGLWVVLAAFLLCDLVQVANILWAYQFAWASTLLCLMLVLTGLEDGARSRWLFALAVLAAAVGSYSTVQGLLIWPAGLTYGLLRPLPRIRVWSWTGFAFASGFIYMWHLGPVYPPVHASYVLTHPLLGLRFLLELMGDFAPDGHLVAGVGVLLGSVLILWLAHRRRLAPAQFRLPLALWLFGMLFDLLVTVGRAPLGFSLASSSRYSTFNALVLIGLYLGSVVVFQPPMRWRDIRARASSDRLAATVCGAAVVLVLFQLAWSLPFGFKVGAAYRLERDAAAQALRNYQHEPDGLLARELYSPSGAYVKAWAPILVARHWSVFS